MDDFDRAFANPSSLGQQPAAAYHHLHLRSIRLEMDTLAEQVWEWFPPIRSTAFSSNCLPVVRLFFIVLTATKNHGQAQQAQEGGDRPASPGAKAIIFASELDSKTKTQTKDGDGDDGKKLKKASE